MGTRSNVADHDHLLLVTNPQNTYNGEVRYKAGKWPGMRRVIIKAEVVRAADKDPKDNPRFVITNMKQSPYWIYEHVYCQRGDIENRLKELHDLEIDRTSCTSFWEMCIRDRVAIGPPFLLSKSAQFSYVAPSF